MKKEDKVELALVKAKANWRKVCFKHDSTDADRRSARAAWKKAQIARDRALAIWRAALLERRRAAADRRKANAPVPTEQDRRKTTRRP